MLQLGKTGKYFLMIAPVLKKIPIMIKPEPPIETSADVVESNPTFDTSNEKPNAITRPIGIHFRCPTVISCWKNNATFLPLKYLPMLGLVDNPKRSKYDARNTVINIIVERNSVSSFRADKAKNKTTITDNMKYTAVCTPPETTTLLFWN